eukprot:COSAG02_NODE_13659_length_1366_cov_1.048145_2_plen_164_part_01
MRPRRQSVAAPTPDDAPELLAMAGARDIQAEMLAQLKRDDARILDDLLDADDLADEEERVSMDSIPLDDYRVAERTCGTNQFGFSKTSELRVSAFRLSQSPAFRNFILVVIFYNIVVMAAASDELMASDEPYLFRAPFAEVYAVNDLVITSIFTFEVAVGMLAH